MGLLRSWHEQLRGRLSVSARQLDHQHAPEKSILRFAKGDYRGDGVRALEGNQCRGSTIEWRHSDFRSIQDSPRLETPCYTVRANAAERRVARSASKPAAIESVLPPGGKEFNRR